MKFWQSIAWTEADQMIEVAKFAEQVGFHGVFLPDHAFYPKNIESRYPYSPDGKSPQNPGWPFPDCWVSIGAMAAATTRLQFSTSVYILPLRKPLEVANATATVAVLSNNRLAIGIGVGWMKEEFDINGVDFHTRGKRTDEMIDIIQKVQRGGPVAYQGKFFNFPEVEISPVPTKPVPIYVGGESVPAKRRAATLCDGWIGSGSKPEQVPGIVADLKKMRSESARAKLPFEIMIPLTVPLEVDTLKRLGDQGMDATFSYPFALQLGLTSTLDQKKKMMEKFANDFIRKVG